jgi:hypothetical protein
MRRMRMLFVLGGAFFLMFTAIPLAAADPCPDAEIARILCPSPGGDYIYVCQDAHSGLPLVHQHCRIF